MLPPGDADQLVHLIVSLSRNGGEVCNVLTPGLIMSTGSQHGIALHQFCCFIISKSISNLSVDESEPTEQPFHGCRTGRRWILSIKDTKPVGSGFFLAAFFSIHRYQAPGAKASTTSSRNIDCGSFSSCIRNQLSGPMKPRSFLDNHLSASSS